MFTWFRVRSLRSPVVSLSDIRGYRDAPRAEAARSSRIAPALEESRSADSRDSARDIEQFQTSRSRNVLILAIAVLTCQRLLRAAHPDVEETATDDDVLKRLRASSFGSGKAGFRLFRAPSADRRPPTADRRPPTADRRPPTVSTIPHALDAPPESLGSPYRPQAAQRADAAVHRPAPDPRGHHPAGVRHAARARVEGRGFRSARSRRSITSFRRAISGGRSWT